MLSQISQSSKRLGKLKKYKSKIKESGFQFLLQSLERDKENHAPNLLTVNHNNLSHSIHIDPLLTAPVHSFTLNSYHPYTNTNKGKFYLENVKLLDRSDISLSDANHSIPSKKSAKYRENSYKATSKSKNNKKQGNKNISSKSKRSEHEQFQDIMYKMKQYLAITDDIMSEIDTSKWKFAKKAKEISQELISAIVQIESKSNKMNLSVKTTSFNMYGSDILNTGKEPEEFVKRINGLEVQRQKLNNLISQHEMANIKMYIKINEGESEEIEQCKKQLALLFEKYKKLQTFIKSDKKKIAEMLNEKEKLTKRCEELKNQNEELMTLIEKYQIALENMKKEKNERADKSMRVSMLRPEKHAREQSYPSYQEQSQPSKSELHIESLQNSCNDSRFSEEIGLSSSITTSTSRINNRKGGRVGINLNALLQNLSQNQIQRMTQQPQKLKKTMKQCKQTILKMQSIISQQNKELEMSIKILQEFKQNLRKKDELICKLQGKIIVLKQSQKEKGKKSKENKCLVNESESKSKRIAKKDEKPKMEVDDRGKVDVNFKKAKFDEYRIIAMQAMALEEALKSKKYI